MEIPSHILASLKNRKERREELYSPFATRDAMYTRRYQRQPEDPVIRPPFSRDADRIVHAKAYSRYIDKTQVFYLVENDHITHRVLHVQLVSKVGRTIGRCLGLNEDLIEAIALGHDIGHVPYGHLGESLLDGLSREHGLWGFRHNEQGVHFLDEVEDCDLTVQVLDGILCHNGERHNARLTVQGEAGWGSFDDKVARIRNGEDIFPCTQEGCVVRCADSISYLGRDLQDALEVDLIGEEELREFPEPCREFFHITDTGRESFRELNRAVLDLLIKDVIANSGEEGIGFSDAASECMEAFRQYNYRHIYEHPALVRQRPRIRNMFGFQFDQLLEEVEQEKRDSPVYRQFLDQPWVGKRYAASATPARVVTDFIAGMTDGYFESLFQDSILPTRVKQTFRKDSRAKTT
jgi:dGTPase